MRLAEPPRRRWSSRRERNAIRPTSRLRVPGAGQRLPVARGSDHPPGGGEDGELKIETGPRPEQEITAQTGGIKMLATWWVRNGGGCVVSLALVLLAIAVAGGAGVSDAAAETITWDNAAGGGWNTATNWDPQDVPNESGEVALFPAGGGAYTVDFDSNFNLDGIQLENAEMTLKLWGHTLTSYIEDGLVNEAQIQANSGYSHIYGPIHNRTAGEIEIHESCNLNVHAASFINDGTIRVNPAGGTGDALFYTQTGDTVRFLGSGEIVLRAPGSTLDARWLVHSGQRLQGADHTTRGSGTITGALNNFGTINADQFGEVLELNGTVKTNAGLITATNGGTLQISSNGVTQTESGRIVADGGTIYVYSATVNGGQFDAVNGGAFTWNGTSYSSGATNLGPMGIPSGQTLRLVGTNFVNEGSLTVNSNQADSDAFLYVSTGDTLRVTGAGEIVLQHNGDLNDARILTHSGVFDFGPGQTIRGMGVIGAYVRNQGLIVADVPDQTLQVAGYEKKNDGQLKATNGGRLQITGGAITQGEAGIILASGGTVNAHSAQIHGGRLDTHDGGKIECTGTSYLYDFVNDGELDVMGYGVVRAAGSGFTNNGRITLNPDQEDADALFYVNVADTLRVDGDGEFVLQTNGDGYDARILTYSGTFDFGPELTIRGEGTIGAYLRNQGLILADAPGRTLWLAGYQKRNDGVLKATNDGVLWIGTGPITQTSGAEVIADGGRVVHNGTTYGGTFSTANGGTLESSGNAYWYDAVLESDARINPGSQMYICGSGMVNNGRILINTGADSPDALLYCLGDTLDVTGQGEIVLRASTDWNDARILTYAGAMRTGPAQTIRGCGRIGIRLINEGTIVADDTTNVLNVGGNEKRNYGTIAATDSATLYLDVGDFRNYGVCSATEYGLFRATTLPYHYNPNTDILNGGTWEVHAPGMMRLDGLDIQTLQAHVLLDGAGATIYSDDGTVDALANLDLIAEGGWLEFANDRDYALAQSLEINRGALTVGAGCDLTIAGDFTQYGADLPQFTPMGATYVNGTLTPSSGLVTVHGGMFGGAGTVHADLVSCGRVDPGASAGTLTIEGAYTQADSGALYVELAEGGHDHLTVTGAATLAGKIWVESIDGFVPEAGATYEVLSCAARTGEFDVQWGSPGEGLIYIINYYGDRVEIEIVGDASDVPEPEDPEGEIALDPIVTDEPLPRELGLTSRAGAGGYIALELALPQPAEVEVELFDFTGRRVASLHRGLTSAGRHAIAWDGRGAGSAQLASGVYFARARVANGATVAHATARVLLVQ